MRFVLFPSSRAIRQAAVGIMEQRIIAVTRSVTRYGSVGSLVTEFGRRIFGTRKGHLSAVEGAIV